ncbi:MAG: response regulator [Cyanobacteria bacterium RU_5_0]|nr:response regulator [Cyanobacteria bacterium RU_5_0]
MATHEITTAHELEQHFQTCSSDQFTGRLDLEIQSNKVSQWSLFFRLGRFVWGASQVHPIRRWCRQLSLHCPQLGIELNQKQSKAPQYWDYDTLAELVRQRKVPLEQVTAVIEGNLVEIMFDIVQLWQQQRRPSRAKLSYRQIPQDIVAATLVLIQVDRVWQQATQTWDAWQKSGLGNWSPNLAPVIWDADELRRQTSLYAFQNLTALLDGDRSLRDLAIMLKQNPLPLLQSIMPCVRQGVMGLVEIGDLSRSVEPAPSPNPEPADVLPSTKPVQTQSVSPQIVYIDDSRFDNLAMNRILSQAGCQCVSIRDPVQALPILLEHKPDLIFLDLLMPVTNGYEVCAQLRRVSMFRDTPVIIVTASDGMVDRVRAKLVGASGFISKPIDSEKVLSVLQQYLPSSLSVQLRQIKTPPAWSPKYQA